MRSLHYFSLAMMALSAFITFTAIAAPVDSPVQPEKIIHVVQNLDEVSLQKLVNVMKARGYAVSLKPVFTESESAILITRIDESDFEPATIEIEVMQKDGKALPKSVHVQRAETANVEEAFALIPTL